MAAQVKAESAARKSKALTKSPTPPLKKQNSREGSIEKQNENSTSSSKESSVEKQEVEGYSKTPETDLEGETLIDQTEGELEETENTEVPTSPVREATPDIIRKSPVKEVVSSSNVVVDTTTVE